MSITAHRYDLDAPLRLRCTLCKKDPHFIALYDPPRRLSVLRGLEERGMLTGDALALLNMLGEEKQGEVSRLTTLLEKVTQDKEVQLAEAEKDWGIGE